MQDNRVQNSLVQENLAPYSIVQDGIVQDSLVKDNLMKDNLMQDIFFARYNKGQEALKCPEYIVLCAESIPGSGHIASFDTATDERKIAI